MNNLAKCQSAHSKFIALRLRLNLIQEKSTTALGCSPLMSRLRYSYSKVAPVCESLVGRQKPAHCPPKWMPLSCWSTSVVQVAAMTHIQAGSATVNTFGCWP